MSNHIVANRNPCCGKWCLWQCYCYVLFSLISQTHIRSFPKLLEQSRSTTYHYGVIHKPRGHWRGCSPNVCWITTCILNNALCFTFQKCPKKGDGSKMSNLWSSRGLWMAPRVYVHQCYTGLMAIPLIIMIICTLLDRIKLNWISHEKVTGKIWIK